VPAKPLRAIVCEGKDDVAVLRALLYGEGGKRKHPAVQDKGYKRAFRLWTAAIEPGSESFAARLFQADETKAACLAAVRRTRAFEALGVLLGG
jgi:hypothetical protein